MKNLLLNIFLTSCLLLSLSTLKTKAQCTSVFQGFATADCSTGEIQVNSAFLGVDPSCLAAVGGFSFDILTAFDDDGTFIFDNIFSMFMGAPIPFFPGGTHYANGPGIPVNLMVNSLYFNGGGQATTTDWYDVGPDSIQGTIDDTYAGTTVDPGFVPVFQTTTITVKFTPGCADPTMPSINGVDLASLPAIPCNTQPDATFTVDNLVVLPGQVVTVTSVAADPNGGTYAPQMQATDLVVGGTYSGCTSFSIINTAQYTGMTGDACLQSYQIDIAVLPFPTNGPIIDEYTCADQIPGITDPTNADGFIWVYEPGATNVYDNCASVDVSGHWTTPDGCNGPIIAGATNPQRCPFPTDNPTVTDNICPSNTDGLFAPPADDPLGNFAWVWDASNPPSYDACLGTQIASGYWEDTECTILTDPRSITSSPTQCCPVITNLPGAEAICHNNSATLLSPVTVDDASLLGFGGADWYINGAPDAGGQVYDAANIIELNTSCSPVDVVLTSYAECACSGVWIPGATYTITVNPAPPTVNPVPGSCGTAASVQLICADGTVLNTKTHTLSPDGLPCVGPPAVGIESDPLAAGSWTAAEIEGFLGVTVGSGCYSEATFALVAADCPYQACCPTVATAASGTDNICVGSAADFATHAAQITLSVGTVGTEATVTWWEDAAFTIAAGTTALNAPTACTEQNITYYANVVCAADGSTLAGGGSFTVNVFHTYTGSITGDGICSQTYSVLDEDNNPCYTVSSTSAAPAAACPAATGAADSDPIAWVNPTNIPCAFTPSITQTTASGCAGTSNCVTCPTVATAASGTDNICVGSAADFATHAAQIALSAGTVGTEATLTWWEDAAFTVAAGTTTLDAPTACAKQNITYYAKLVCVSDGSTLAGGGSFTVNVFHTYTESITGDGVCSQTYSVLDEDSNICYTVSSTSIAPAAACPAATGAADSDPIAWVNPTNIPVACAFTPSIAQTTASGCVGTSNCACPTVTTPASGASTICHNDAAPSFPTITLSSGVLGTDYTIAWTAIVTTNSTCGPITTTYTPTITCVADGSVIADGGSFDVTVYPDPANFTVLTTPGVCGSAPTAILELISDGTGCNTHTGSVPTCVVAPSLNYSFTVNGGQTCETILSGVVTSSCGNCATFVISDPCSCNNNATVAANDGTFGETVAVWNDLDGDGILDANESSAPLPAQIWTVTAQTGASGVTAGLTTLTYGVIPGLDNPSGISGYYVTFNHVDAVGYTMSVEGPAASGTGGNITLSKANACTYPNPSLSVVGSPFCSTAAAVTLAGTTPNGANTAATPYSGTGVTGSQFNPATAGVGGPYTITYSYDPAGDGNNQCLQPTTTSVSVVTCPVCGASPNMQWND